ncbi:MAG: hypothetical protein WAT23_15990 [Chromatiaceae bacterium]
MNASNVIDHPAASWEKAQTAFEHIKRKEGELLDHWIELGTQLNLLRRRFPADQEFGAACESHGIDMTHQHRKAAMWWAGLDDDQRDSLREYYPTAIHPSSLERKCRNDFPEWITSTRRALGSSETDPSPTPDTEKTPETVSTPAETADETEQKSDDQINVIVKESQPVSNKRLDSRCILVKTVGLDVATVINNHWTNPSTQLGFNALAKTLGGQKVIKRIAEIVPLLGEATHINASPIANGTIANSFSHRLFVPGLPKQWARFYGAEWTKVSAIKVILDQVPDAIRMNQELGDLADLATCQAWWKTRDRPSSQKPDDASHGPDLAAFQVATVEDHMIKPAHGAEAHEILVHGVKIWPVEHDDYEFLDAWAAFHFWQDLTRHEIGLKDEGAASRGRFMMEMKGWLQYASIRFANAFHKIAASEHSHPDQHALTHCPPKHFKTK